MSFLPFDCPAIKRTVCIQCFSIVQESLSALCAGLKCWRTVSEIFGDLFIISQCFMASSVGSRQSVLIIYRQLIETQAAAPVSRDL